MSDSKKSKKPAAQPAPFAETLLSAVVDTVDDGRAELHKQVAALLAFSSGLVQGGFSWLGTVNDRVDGLASAGLSRVNELGTNLLAQTRALPEKAGQTARDAAERAVDSAKVLTASPSKKAA